MNLQYITDSEGNTTGVFIPINEWNELKLRFTDIEEESLNVPEWHQEIVRKRIELYKKDNGQALDFNSVMDEIEKSFNV